MSDHTPLIAAGPRLFEIEEAHLKNLRRLLLATRGIALQILPAFDHIDNAPLGRKLAIIEGTIDGHTADALRILDYARPVEYQAEDE